jgi:hypothetical protein
MNKSWLEPTLARHLGRMKAPDELWDRVQAPRAQQQEVSPKPAFFGRKLAWTMAAAAVAAAGVWMLHQPRDPIAENEALAARTLNGGASRMEFRSEQAPEIRAWVKAKAGLDIPLPVSTSAAVRLLGAHVTAGRDSTAEILYQVNGRNAVLTIAKVDPKIGGDGSHRFLGGGTRDGARTSSWTMRGQMYTVACPFPVDPRAGCTLCHASGPPDAIAN